MQYNHRVQLVLSVDNMNTSVSGRESLNGAAEPGAIDELLSHIVPLEQPASSIIGYRAAGEMS